MKNSSLIISVVLILVCSLGINAQPMKGKGFHNKMSMERIEQFKDELGLTQDQQDKIKDLMYKTKSESIDLEAAAKKAELDLQMLEDKDKFDMSEAEKIVDKYVEAKSELMKLQIMSKLEMTKTILTADQIKKLGELKKNAREKMRNKMKGRNKKKARGKYGKEHKGKRYWDEDDDRGMRRQRPEQDE